MLVRMCTCSSVSCRFVVGVDLLCRGEVCGNVGRVSCVCQNVVLMDVVLVVVVVCVYRDME